MLANRVSGDLAGVWLLVAEHLRLNTWDLLCQWTRQSTPYVQPRLALQLVHEAAVCTAGIRAERTLHTRGGFELANGLPFVASDVGVHQLLAARTVADSQRLQAALGKRRQERGHFRGKLLAIDPHRTRSHSRRLMRERVEIQGHRPIKMAQTFWALDADTHQPVCFTSATAARSVVTATPELLDLANEILQPGERQTLVVADSEHFSSDLLADVQRRAGFDLLTPLPNQAAFRKAYAQIPESEFTRHWAGYATAKVRSNFTYGTPCDYWRLVQRTGERSSDWRFQGFASTRGDDEVWALTEAYPDRWHVEEFFRAHQSLGWKRSGTQNLNIRYGQMSLALIAQAVIHQLRERLGAPFCDWDSDHLAKDLFFALEGDVRVDGDTIIVTYYNAPNARQLETHYHGLPAKLTRENIRPEIPWLFNYKLNFRFR